MEQNQNALTSVWKLFEATGNLAYYSLYFALVNEEEEEQ